MAGHRRVVRDRRAAAILYRALRSTPRPGAVVLPANVCPIVARACTLAGRPFLLMDVDPATLALDPPAVAAVVRRRRNAIAAMVYVRPYGARTPAAAADLAEIRAASPELLLIDDQCLSRPSPRGMTVVPAADLTLFSTGPRKYLDLGGGGFAFARERCETPRDRLPPDLSDPSLPDAIDGARRPGRVLAPARYPGSMASSLAQMDRHKASLNAIYGDQIPIEAQWPAAFQRWRFNVLVRRPELLERAVRQAGLFSSRHYVPLEGRTVGSLTTCRWIAAHVVNLFNDRWYDRVRADRTAEIVRRHVLRHGVPERGRPPATRPEPMS
jgi:DegT/DnrJ/EryC1/StrS aminotransferase family